MKILFCKTGWMNYYNGLNKSDKITGGGRFVKDNGKGGEIFNFSNSNGKYYGFVMHTGNQVRIEKLGANLKDDYVDNILVVWLATLKDGGVRIVGWYKNARVHRYLQPPIKGSARETVDYHYNIEARVENCILLPYDERTFIIPLATKNTGGIGQSNVWYAAMDKDKLIKKKAENYIINYEKNKGKVLIRRKGKVDTLAKLKVEINAVSVVKDYYERLDYTITSVEKDNLGWDLEAKLNEKIIKIEVKGLSGSDVSVNLTPNEYKNMKLYKEEYRLCIVTNALKYELARLNIFSYNAESDSWMDYDQNEVIIEEKVSAKIYL